MVLKDYVMFVIVTLTYVMVRRTWILLYVISEVVLLFSRTKKSCSCVNGLIVLSGNSILLFNHLAERCDWKIALFSS